MSANIVVNGKVWNGIEKISCVDEDNNSVSFELTAGSGYMPNILINPDFSINQRGEAQYSNNNIYTVDRWKMYSNNAYDNGVVVTPVGDSGGIYVTVPSAATDNLRLIQKLDVRDIGVLGQKIVFTVARWDGANIAKTTIKAQVPDEPPLETTVLAELDDYEDFLKTKILLDDDFILQFIIEVEKGTQNAIIAWAKAEIGSGATPYVKPDPAIELLKCQRYGWGVWKGNTQLIGYGVLTTANNANLILRYPVKMRKNNPSLDLVGVDIVNINDNTLFYDSQIVYGISQCTNTDMVIFFGVSSPNTIGAVGDIIRPQPHDSTSRFFINAEID